MIDAIGAGTGLIRNGDSDDRAFDRLISIARGIAVVTGAPVGAVLRDMKTIMKRFEEEKRKPSGKRSKTFIRR